MIFVDTSAWYTLSVPTDPNHLAASRLLRENRLPLVITDYIVDETLTLLKSRGERQRALRIGQQFFTGEIATIHRLTDDELRAAWETFQRFTDKDWSFTDCTSKVVIEKLGIAHAFSFDEHFRQFGAITVMP